MPFLRLIILASTLWFCGSAVAQRWIPYASASDGFRIMAPGEFTIEEIDFEIEYDAYHYISRIEGHQLQTTNPDQTRTFAALYLYESRLYVIDATASPDIAPPGMFQQTLEFIDEDGEVITFRNFPDDRKVSGTFTRSP
jgi:hypothetical protein